MATLPTNYTDATTPTGALTELPATTSRGINAINGQINTNTTAITTIAPVFNVKSYGAVGDGSTVDTTAFTTAIAAAVTAGGGIVYAPTGTYKIGGVALATGVTLRGAGIGATTLKMNHGGSDTLVLRVTAGATTAGNRIGLEQLTIDGDKATLGSGNTATRYGYYMGVTAGTAVTDCWVDHCEFRSCKTYALDVLEVSRITITNSVSHDNGYTTGTGNNCSGFEIHANDVLVANCVAYNNANHGFFAGNGTAHARLRMQSCLATGNTFYGFNIGDSMTDASVTGGASYSNSRVGVNIGPNAHRTMVTGVTIKDNAGYPGIDIYNSNNCVVSGCELYNNNAGTGFDDDIKIEGSSAYTLVVGNNIVGSTTGGDKCVREHDTANFTQVVGNIFSGTSITPITLTGANSSGMQLPLGSFTIGKPRIGTVASSATPSINCDLYDQYNITALAAAITSVTITGTPVDGQQLRIRFKDNGTLRAITLGSSFVAGPAALITTTAANKTHFTEYVYDSVAAKWACTLVHTAGY